MFMAFCACKSARHSRQQFGAIRKAGQGVKIRQETQFFFGAFTVSNIAHHRHTNRCCALFGFDAGKFDADQNIAAIFAPLPHFAFPAAVFTHHFLDALILHGIVARRFQQGDAAPKHI